MVSQCWKIPILSPFIVTENCRCLSKIKGMRKVHYRFNCERHIVCSFPHKSGNGFWHNTVLLSDCTTLNEHFKVEPFCCKTFKGVLANRPELLLVNIPEKTLFQIFITQSPSI